MAVPEIFRWIFDVQFEWPCPEHVKPGRDAARRWALEPDTKRALDLLPTHEREKVLGFYFIRDAKLSLGSQLLKHCAVVRTCNVLWSESSVSKDRYHKPCYIPAGAAQKQMEFNVSHHGTLVALAGSADKEIQVGVDIVQVDCSKDIPKVRQEGWPSWVATYETVFSDQEVQNLESWEPSDALTEEDTLRSKLRYFYAHWCLKEAYAKMTGEALTATWLKDMESRNVRAPRAASELINISPDSPWGENCPDIEIWRNGVKLVDVKVELQAFRDDYMLATATSSSDASLLSYQILDLQNDVFSVAHTK